MKINEQHVRTAAVIGADACERLKNAKVAVFGVGGVGGLIVEALARAGIGYIDVYDGDSVSESNLNRQIIALHSNIGKSKVDVIKDRILDINPECKVNAYSVFYIPENADEYPLDGYDYIADAVDTVAAKIELAVKADDLGIPIIAAMGAGNKLDPTKFVVSDIYKTQVCPLAKAVRRELKLRGVKRLKCVYSTEPSVKTENGIVGSMPFVPGVMGYIMAGEIIKDLLRTIINQTEKEKKV